MTDLVIFDTISNFINNLNEIFGTEFVNLQLYNRILEKTTVSHKDAITKHVELFREWCRSNEKSILDKNYSEFEENKISYSDKVFINFTEIFEKSDLDTKKVIWQHILTICAMTNPQIKAKEILQKENDKTNENNFLKNMIEKVEDNVGDTTNISNPMEAMGSMMSSGIFNDLVNNMTSGLQNGELDLGKLMGSVNDMVTSLSDEVGNSEDSDDPNMSHMMSNLTSMMSDLNKKVGEN